MSAESKSFLQALSPALPPGPPKEALRGAVGAMLGLLFTHAVLWALAQATGSGAATGFWAHPLLIAPFGATAVLVYAVPASPLAQPWSVVVGNGVSGLCAILVLHLGLPPVLTLILAALLALTAMGLARALHPPGGAVAVATVLAAAPDHMPGLSYLILTVILGSALLVAFGVLYHRAQGRRYPGHPPAAPTAPMPPPERRLVPTPLALAAALDRLRLGANLGVDDLAELIETAETMVVSQSIGLSAAEIMTPDPITVGPSADWKAISALFAEHGFRCLPVVDEMGRLQGMIPIQAMLRPGAPGLTAHHLMEPGAPQPPTATLADLLPTLAQGHQIALPVVEDHTLVGVITRSDIVAALVHAMAHS